MAMEAVQFQNFGHVHPLVLIETPETDDSWDLSCYACEGPISALPSSSSSYYGCKECEQCFLHKTCRELPHNLTHPSHPQHPLTLLPDPSPGSRGICDICGRTGSRFLYRCVDCNYDIDIKCALMVLCIQQCVEHTRHPHQLIPLEKESMFLRDACGIKDEGTFFSCTTCGFWVEGAGERPRRETAMEVVQHLGHYDPLMLIKSDETDDSWDLSCFGCEQPISDLSSYYYGCKSCSFFLHKTCAQLPSQMTLPSHPQHPLTLLADRKPENNCDACGCNGISNRLFYLCDVCDYGIDIKCALMVLSIQQISIEHTSHPHQLFPCDACGQEHKGTSFLCTTCGFWINQKCASSPRNLKLNNRHHHTLSLFYFIPLAHYWPSLCCKICSERIYRRFWVYCCSKCHYLVHLRCALSDKQHSTASSKKASHPLLRDYRNNETENRTHDHGLDTINLSSCNSTTATSDVDQHKIIQLPMLDDSADIITQFIKNTATQGKHKGAAEIKHGSHDHPLTLFENPIDHTPSPLNGAWIDGKCIGCAQTISAPFYGCVECKFFLHVWCAELPEELRHPGHPTHTLYLNNGHRVDKCSCCNLWGTALFYRCKECANSSLDCKCSSLPRVIKHESHGKHTLALRPTSLSSTTCISCSAIVGISFECRTCKFNLCGRCALLPRTVQHRYDKHPFTLTYSPPPYRTDDDFCEICEEGIDFNRWFYHCGKCNRYLHTDCILPVNQFSNMLFEHKLETFNSRKHPHRLIGVKPLPNESCSLCTQMISDGDEEFLCQPCDFRICSSCKRKEIEGGF